MRRLFLVLAFTGQVYADEIIPKKIEIQGAPYFGYSNFNGFSLGLDAAVFIPMSSHWQWRFGMEYQISKYITSRAFNTGANYNFDEDWSRSIFVGLGAGFGERRDLSYGIESKEDNPYLYADLGKRFRLNQSGSFMWAPHVTVDTLAPGRGHVTVSPLNFSWSF